MGKQGGAFSREGTASAQALRGECAWCVEGLASRLVGLEWNKLGREW